MSRHKFVKNLDLKDELDDYDGVENYDYSSQEELKEISEEDQEQMRISTIAVRARLSPSINYISDKQIQNSLWHTYYDVDRTLAYLSRTYTLGKSSLSKNLAIRHNKGVSLSNSCSCRVSTENVNLSLHMRESTLGCSTHPYREFFKDTPWLNVPFNLQTTFTAPLSVRGGLLGGSGSSELSKISKLQALAASRKKIAQQQKSATTTDVENSLVKLHLSHGRQVGDSASSDKTSRQILPRSFPIRKRTVSNPVDPDLNKNKNTSSISENVLIERDISLNIAKPSAFANTIFSSIPLEDSRQHFLIPCPIDNLATDPFADPSPDDVVLATQSKAKGRGKNRQQSKDPKTEKLVDGINSFKLIDSSRFKDKNLDVLQEFERKRTKNIASFVVIGHVDAGKSTLMGRLLLDIGVIDQRTIDRYKKEAEAVGKSSFAMAWVFDQGTEERERGVTIDIALNEFETTKTKFTIVDAPGHRDFIPNMIAGASQADFAVLVIDASIGSFESGLKGQTREHVLLVRSIGIQKIIIAVNKLDVVQWSQERYTEIKTQISSFLTTAGYQSKNLLYLPCSGLFGYNITRGISHPAGSWYVGPTLVELLDSIEPISHALTKPLRISISNVFRNSIQSPVSVTGRIEAGSLQVAETLLVQPSSQSCIVKSLEIDNRAVDWAVAGQNITIHLTGIEEQHLRIGDILSSPSNPIQNVKEFSAKVLAFDFILPMQVDVYRGRLNTTGHVREIKGILDKTSGNLLSKKKPRIVKPGNLACIAVTLDQAVPLETQNRVVLRSNGSTVAAGLLE